MRSARRVVAITGASRGIGRAASIAFARRGYRVFALARSLPDLEALQREALSCSGNIVPHVLDVADDSSRSVAVEFIMGSTEGYGVDVLVNNAGYGQFGPLEEVPVENLRHEFEVNVVGLLAFTQPFLAPMRERRAGRVVNMSSVAGRIATPFLGAYNASKFALEGMSDALRMELAPFGVRVVLIEPGPIGTNFGEASRTASIPEDPSSSYAAYQRRFRGAKGVSDRLGRSVDAVADVIVRAAEAPRPRARYTITVQAKVGTLAGRFLPARVVDWAFRFAMGLRP